MKNAIIFIYIYFAIVQSKIISDSMLKYSLHKCINKHTNIYKLHKTHKYFCYKIRPKLMTTNYIDVMFV